MPVSWHVRALLIARPLWNLLFSAEMSDVIILLDLASLPPRDGGGQVSELHRMMSKPILLSLHRKWPSFEMVGRLMWLSNGLTRDPLKLFTRPVCSFIAFESASLTKGMILFMYSCQEVFHLLCIFVFVFFPMTLHFCRSFVCRVGRLVLHHCFPKCWGGDIGGD